MSRRGYPESLFPALGRIPAPRSDFIPAGSSPGEPTALPFAHSANGWAPTTGGHSALLFSVLTPCLRCCRDPHSAGEQTAAR